MDKTQTLEERLTDFKSSIKYKVDRHEGLSIDENGLSETLEQFACDLPLLMEEIEKQGARSIWLKIPISKSSYIETAAKQGLVFHHTVDDFLMMNKWVEKGTDNKLPGFATHYIGVGGMVLNDSDEILLIQENRYVDNKPFWKLPGGLVENNEDLEEAVLREVKEETGVTATVTGVLGFREVKNFMFGKNDMYFVFLMHADKNETEINIQEDEIAQCEWVPCKDFAEKAPILSPLLQKIAPIFNAGNETPEKVLEQYRKENSKEDMLKIMSLTNKKYDFRNRTNNMYLSKFIKDCMRLGSKL